MILYIKKFQTGGANLATSYPTDVIHPLTQQRIYDLIKPKNKAESDVYRQYLLAKTGRYDGNYTPEDQALNSAGRSYPISGLQIYPDFPYQGDDHWNVSRFAYAPFFGDTQDLTSTATWNNYIEHKPVPFPKEYTALNDEQKRAYLLEDMFKYYFADPNTGREDAWKKANDFIVNEIDPKLKSDWHNKVGKYSTIVTNFDDGALVFSKQTRDNLGLKNMQEAEDLLKDYLINFKKLTPAEADSQVQARKQYHISQFPKEMLNQDLAGFVNKQITEHTQNSKKARDFFKQFDNFDAYKTYMQSTSPYEVTESWGPDTLQKQWDARNNTIDLLDIEKQAKEAFKNEQENYGYDPQTLTKRSSAIAEPQKDAGVVEKSQPVKNPEERIIQAPNMPNVSIVYYQGKPAYYQNSVGERVAYGSRFEKDWQYKMPTGVLLKRKKGGILYAPTFRPPRHS